MKKEYVLFLIFPISQLMLVAGDYSVTRNTNIFSSGGFVLSIVADIVLLFVLIRGTKKEKIEKELEELKYLKEIERERNELLEKSQQELYAMRADFERRIKEIERKMESGKKADAIMGINKLQRELDHTRKAVYCHNPVVNAVMSEKAKECNMKNISLETKLLIPRRIEVEPLHICSIFSNLMDNAIEAVVSYEGVNNTITVDAAIKGNYLFIKVKNPSTKDYVNRKRRKERGYGTQILTDIAKKYDGNYETSFNNDYYSAVVMVKAV